jgi:hypothetical protein
MAESTDSPRQQVNSDRRDQEARRLLELLGMPFARENQ